MCKCDITNLQVEFQYAFYCCCFALIKVICECVEIHIAIVRNHPGNIESNEKIRFHSMRFDSESLPLQGEHH